MNNLTIRKMRILLAAVEEGSFTRASVRENISQPAATIVINEIEESIGAQLFERRGNVRQAKVTDAGRLVTETFARIVAVYDSETSSIDELIGGKFSASRVLLQRGFSDSLCGAWILSVGEAFSPCQISVETLERPQIVDAIRGREASIGLIDGMAEDERCEQIELGRYSLVLATPTPHAETDTGAIDDWELIPRGSVVFGDLNSPLERRLKREIESNGGAFDSLMRVTNAVAIARIMRESGRPAIVPDLLIPVLNDLCPCHASGLPGPSLEGSIGLVAPWGMLGKAGLLCAVQSKCFDSAHVV